MPVLLIGVTILIFAMLSLLTPYERVALYVQDIPKRQGAMDELIVKYGLDDPIPVQYWHWMVGQRGSGHRRDQGRHPARRPGLVQGRAQRCGRGHRPPLAGDRRAGAVVGIVPMIGIGIWLGVLSAVNHNKLTRPDPARVQHHRLVHPHLCVWPA